MFEMKPEYYIGIDMIDQEHKQLFDYANEAYELLQEEFTPDKYDKIDAILEKLRDYTVKHFTDEEAYMESIQYKKIFTQKIQHQEFIKKLDEFIDQHEKDEGDQEEVDDGADQVADGEDPHFDGGDALGAFSTDQGDDGVDNVVHHCRDDGGKGGADDHAYGQINDIASHEEGF